MAPPISPRVFVRSQPCPFGTSVFDTIVQKATTTVHDDDTTSSRTTTRRGTHRHHYDRILVSLQEQNENLHLSPATRAPTSTKESSRQSICVIPMGRARECPALDSTACPTTIAAVPSSSYPANKPWTSLAVVGLLLDATARHVLITRRPTYMRSFPGAWVLPGGSVEANESLQQAVAREVQEETGIATNAYDWRPECIWESVFPTQVLDPNEYQMKAHHTVVFLSNRLPNNGSSLELSLQLCSEEVDGATWLSRDHVNEILSETTSSTREKRSATILSLQKTNPSHAAEDLPLSELVGIYPQPKPSNSDETCGLAQGSLFALQEFCTSTSWDTYEHNT